ncbi:MAG: hypothetical protein WKF76_09800 [Nocardioidaceae bacterium]
MTSFDSWYAVAMAIEIARAGRARRSATAAMIEAFSACSVDNATV